MHELATGNLEDVAQQPFVDDAEFSVHAAGSTGWETSPTVDGGFFLFQRFLLQHRGNAFVAVGGASVVYGLLALSRSIARRRERETDRESKRGNRREEGGVVGERQ